MKVCRLCLQEKELCNNSHIVPDFMYQELFDDKHRLFRGNPLIRKNPKIIQSGEKEGGLLCAGCDNGIIGGYEGYASKVLYGGETGVTSRNIKKADDGLELTLVEGLDYRMFKLFLLSLLWRASVSTAPFFSSVNLGPHEEKLRLSLLSGDPGASASYPCIMNSYQRTGLPTGVISAPRKSRFVDGKIIYSFIISGMIYVFRITEDETTDWILEVTIKENGAMQIPHLTRESANGLFNSLLGQEVFK